MIRGATKTVKAALAMLVFASSSALGQGTYCPGSGPGRCPDFRICNCPPPPRSSDGKGNSPDSIGDPVTVFGEVAYTRDELEDLRLNTSLGTVSFQRRHFSSDVPWNGSKSGVSPPGGWLLAGVPKPFGASRVTSNSLRWTHNFFAFVDVRASPTWVVRAPAGHQDEFVSCTAPCWAGISSDSPGQLNRLEWAADGGFTYYEQTGRRYAFGARTADAGMYFLSSVQDSAGTELAAVSYGPPGGGCAGLSAGGVPFVSQVAARGGGTLAFTYAAKGSPTECVLTSVSALGTDAGVTYTYQDDLPGHLSGVTTPQFAEAFSNYDTAFVVERAGVSVVTHTRADGGSVTSAQDRSGSWILDEGLTGTGTCFGNGCCANTMERSVTVSSAKSGDGAGTSAGLVERYGFAAGYNMTRHEHIPIFRIDSCTASDACSPGSIRWFIQGALNPAGACEGRPAPTYDFNPGYVYATKDKRDNWTVTPNQFVTFDGGTHAFEQVALYRGVPSSYSGSNAFPDAGAGGANALETTTMSWTYINGSQLLQAETRPSALGGSVLTSYARDTAGRLTARYVSGSTMLVDGGTVPRTLATFWSYDSAGRVLEENGPCFVADAGITSCPGLSHPRTVNTYYGPGNGLSSGQLATTSRYYDSSNALVTTFQDYTPLGDPGEVIDENGVHTVFSYAGHQVTSRQVLAGANPKWEYTWENEKVTLIKSPEADSYQTFCYRDGATASGCAGNWIGRLTRQAKSDGTGNWSEAIVYTYRTDGTLSTETRYTSSGDAGVARFTRSFDADAHKRPTHHATGSSGTFSEKRGFDGADNLQALGRPFNNPPSYCKSGGALSRACAQMFYDRADRIRQLDLYADASSFAVKRVCIDYDMQGNVNRVTSGCGKDDSCSNGTAPSSCTGQPATNYVTDDFGNVVQVEGAGSYNDGTASFGIARFEYDALGNVVKQQTERQRTHPSIPKWIVRTWDRLGRPTQVAEVWNVTTTPTSFVVSEFDYDSGGSSPPSGCPQPDKTAGRLRRSRDPLFTRWYQYDGEGRVTREIRLPDGATTCVGALDLILTYTVNGNLQTLTYGHGRQVTYVYGDGELSDRESSMVVKKFLTDGGVADQTLVDQITWEPYGGLRSYRMHFEDGGTATLDYEMGAASTTPATDCPTSALSEAVDHTGRLRSIRLSGASGDIYRKTYQWSADEVTRTAACYKGNTSNVVLDVFAGGSTYGYDNAGRLRGSYLPDYATQGGPDKENSFLYDGRDNITRFRVTPQAHDYTFSYSGTTGKRDQLTSIAWGASYNRTNFSYDSDGRVTSIYGPNDSSGYPGSQLNIDYDGDNAISPGSLTAARSIDKMAVDYNVIFNYWYDNQQRRQLKVYALDDRSDLFLYDLGHQLLEDRGNADLTTEDPDVFPIDEYIWLGGHPIAVYRANLELQVDGSLKHAVDGVGTCTRMNEAVDCGVHYVVSDYLPKPLLTVNFRGQVAGAAEYNHYGTINRVQYWFMQGFPYTQGASGPVWSSFKQRDFGMKVEFRNHFTMLDTEADCNGALREGPSLWDGEWNNMHWALYGYHRGDTWSAWVRGYDVLAGWKGLTLGWGTVSGNCAPGCSGSCPAPGSGWDYMGFVHREYEYRRYDTGAKPYFPPLRFPGHYWDEETDLFENWHRNYFALAGRYLSPEPMLQAPEWMIREAMSGFSTPTYAYARNNPIKNTDPTGLCTSTYDCCIQNHPGNPGACGGFTGPKPTELPEFDPKSLAKPVKQLVEDVCTVVSMASQAVKNRRCTKKLGDCLDTSTASQPGSVPGESRCVTCYDICRDTGKWPATTGDGLSCGY